MTIGTFDGIVCTRRERLIYEMGKAQHISPTQHHELRIAISRRVLIAYCSCGWLNGWEGQDQSLNDLTDAYRDHLP